MKCTLYISTNTPPSRLPQPLCQPLYTFTDTRHADTTSHTVVLCTHPWTTRHPDTPSQTVMKCTLHISTGTPPSRLPQPLCQPMYTSSDTRHPDTFVQCAHPCPSQHPDTPSQEVMKCTQYISTDTSPFRLSQPLCQPLFFSSDTQTGRHH